jgi:hypothetical protein
MSPGRSSAQPVCEFMFETEASGGRLILLSFAVSAVSSSQREFILALARRGLSA